MRTVKLLAKRLAIIGTILTVPMMFVLSIMAGSKNLEVAVVAVCMLWIGTVLMWCVWMLIDLRDTGFYRDIQDAWDEEDESMRKRKNP